MNITTGNVLLLARREEEALGYFQEAARLEPNVTWPHERIAICRASLGRLEEALAGLDAIRSDVAKSLDVLSTRSYVLGRLGRLDEARAGLRELEARTKSEYVSWERFAYAYLGLDELDKLAKLMNEIKIFGSLGRLRLRHETAYDPVRGDARFARVFQLASINEVAGSWSAAAPVGDNRREQREAT